MYVEDQDGRFKCNFCRRDFAGGASRIKFHLAGVKGHAIDICANVPEDVQKEAYLVIGGSNKKLKSASSSSNAKESKTTSCSISRDLCHATNSKMCGKKDKSAVDKLLAWLLIVNNISFDVVQTTSFICFVEKFKENSEIKNGISFILENLVAIEEREDFMKQVQLYCNKVPSLFTITAKTMLKTSHPRIWWDFCGDRLPILQRLNSMMMEKFNTGESLDLEPIYLDKLNELPEYVDHEQFWEDDAFRGVVEKVIDG
ncbi:hypothetical protein CMV_008091 [Castanea mollissima]|uniref:BED-type domain-containing protein n=1 Tax=Castanea mollissima TaxID=60419 RepID=A0A8J4VSD3_9ROSI|nr:hypothetical protein CMV_008091 [Castanea mollissima]